MNMLMSILILYDSPEQHTRDTLTTYLNYHTADYIIFI